MLKLLGEFSLEELTKDEIEQIFNNLTHHYPCKENAATKFEFSGEKYFLFPFTYVDYDEYDFISSYSIRKSSLLIKDEIYNITRITKIFTNVSSYNTKINGSDDEIREILKFLKAL